MKKRILSMMLCCFMLFGMIVIVSADSTTPDHTRAGCDAVWFESFEGFEAGATDLPAGWEKGDKTRTYVYTADSTTIENMVPHHGEKYLCVYNQSRMVFDEGEYSHTVSVPSSLELPEFQLESNQKYFLTFDVRHLMTGNFARDTIGIYVSVAGKEYERIQYHEINSKESAEWETVEVDLSAYAGSTVRIKLKYTQEDQFHPSLVFDCFYLWKVDIAAPVANFSMFYYGYQREIAKTAVTQSPYNAGIKWDSGYGNGYFICTDPTNISSVFSSRVPADSTAVYEADTQYYLCCLFDVLDTYDASKLNTENITLTGYGAAENLLMYNPNDMGYTYYAIFKLPILTATPDTDPITHSITVTADENGTASASAEAAVKDTEITLTAAPKEGFRFKEWQVIKGGIEITDNKFVMPDEDVEVKAIFEAIPEVIPEEHSITIIPVGKGKTYSVPKTAVAGTEITLHAEPDSGWIFYGWEEVVEEGVDKVTIASDKFIMPDRDVVIRVIFVKESSIKVTTDGNGTASADKEKALNGEEITLTATPKEGYAFKEWQVIKGNVEIKDNKFIMPDEDVEIKAIFAAEHKIVVLTDKNGTASASATDAIAGTEIVLTAKGNDGYYFKEWQVIRGNVEIKDNKFVMPDEDVTVKAIFAEIKDAPNDDDMNVKRDIHFVLVKTDGNGVGVAYPPYSEAGTKVTVVAIAKPGYKFKEWKVVKGGVELENKSIATFEMPAENVILEAIFESDGTEGDKPTLPDLSLIHI